jgi:hypothetical protein
MFALQGHRKRGPIDIPPWEELKTPLLDEINHSENDVVISAESLDAALVPVFLQKLEAGLKQPFDRVVALVALRHPLERAASAYNQNIKDLAVEERRMPARYLKDEGASFRLSPMVKQWQALPIEVQFLNYHPSSTLVARFLQAIGHEQETVEAKTRNRSISGYGLVTLLSGRQIGLTKPQLLQLFEALRKDRTHNPWIGPSFPFAPNDCKQFLSDVAHEDLQQVHKLTGISIPQVSSEKIHSRFRLSTDQIAAIRAHLLSFDLTVEQTALLDKVLDAFAAKRAA